MLCFATRNLPRSCVPMLALVLLLISMSTAGAQGGVGSTRGLPTSTGGIGTIQGRVFFPDQNANKRVRIKLESVNFVSQSVLTDEDGVFLFNQLEAGTYTITVDGGTAYEPAIESVSVDRRFVSVPIYLKPKPDPSIPQSAIDLYRKGQESARAGSSKKAVEQLESALAIYPNFPQALSELGIQYMKLAQMDKAAATFEGLLKLKSDDAAGNLNLGIALYNQGTALFNEKKLDEAQKKLDGAEAHLREAIRLNSPGPTAHYYLAMTLIRFRAYDEARKELELAISNGGENLPQAHRYLGGLYQSAHLNKEAADELEKYLNLDPKAADAERIRGIIKELRGSKP